MRRQLNTREVGSQYSQTIDGESVSVGHSTDVQVGGSWPKLLRLLAMVCGKAAVPGPGEMSHN